MRNKYVIHVTCLQVYQLKIKKNILRHEKNYSSLQSGGLPRANGLEPTAHEPGRQDLNQDHLQSSRK